MDLWRQGKTLLTAIFSRFATVRKPTLAVLPYRHSETHRYYLDLPPFGQGRKFFKTTAEAEAADATMLLKSAEADGRMTTLHVIAVDQTQTKSALVKGSKRGLMNKRPCEPAHNAVILCTFDEWRVRLVVRTQPSQGWCTGSTPVRAVAVSNRSLIGFPAFIFLLAVCCGLASGCSKGVSRSTAASVLSVKGSVVFGMEENNLQPVTLESRIHDGNIMRTLDGALLNLALIPPALAQISSNSEIKIQELTISKDGNQTDGGVRNRSARIGLSRGKITVLFSQSVKSGSQLAISAPLVTITADSDCLFRIQSDGITTRLTCVRGEIFASSSAQRPVAIGAGYFQQWPSVRPEAIAAADDTEAQIDIVDSLEIGNQLRELQSGWQNRRPF